MSLLFKANFRLARHYQQKLTELDGAYRSGGVAAERAIGEFGADWEQLTEKQAWCAANYRVNLDLAAFCSSYSIHGSALLELVGTPQNRRQWIDDGLMALNVLSDDSLIPRDEHRCTHWLHLGWIVAAEGDDGKAMQYYEQAEAIAIRLLPGSLVLCRIYDGRGQILLRQEQYSGAKRYFEQALTLARHHNSHADECRLLNNLGFIYTGLCDYQHALDHCQQSLAIAQHPDTRNRRYEAIALNSIGNIYLTQGYANPRYFEDAARYYNAAQVIYQELKNKRGEMQIKLYLGQVYRGQGKLNEADTHYQEAERLAQTLSDKRFEVSAIYNRALLYEACGRTSEGLELAKQARSIYQQLNIPTMIEDVNRLINILNDNRHQRR